MKVRCKECHWIGEYKQILSAPNPFDTSETIHGCPECTSVESCDIACDEPNCKDFASCGTPTATGYRHTCGKHMP